MSTAAPPSRVVAVSQRALVFMRSLFTDHLLAKFFALVFATALYVLIEWELKTEWIQETEEIQLVLARAGGPEGTRHRVVLKPEGDDVAVVGDPGTMRLLVRGPKKDLPAFQKNFDCITVQVKRSWANEDPPYLRSWKLEPEHFRVGNFAGVEIEIPDTASKEILVDLFETRRNVKVVMANPPANVESWRITPSTVNVRGPRSALDELLRNNQWEIDVELPAGRLESGKYVGQPRDVYASRQVRATATNSNYAVQLQMRSHQELEIDLVPVRWSFDDAVLKQIAQGKVSLQVEEILFAKIAFRVPIDDHARYTSSTGKDELRKMLQVQLEPSELIGGSTRKTSAERLPVRVYGFPNTWELVRTTPDTIAFTIERNI